MKLLLMIFIAATAVAVMPKSAVADRIFPGTMCRPMFTTAAGVQGYKYEPHGLEYTSRDLGRIICPISWDEEGGILRLDAKLFVEKSGNAGQVCCSLTVGINSRLQLYTTGETRCACFEDREAGCEFQRSNPVQGAAAIEITVPNSLGLYNPEFANIHCSLRARGAGFSRTTLKYYRHNGGTPDTIR